MFQNRDAATFEFQNGDIKRFYANICKGKRQFLETSRFVDVYCASPLRIGDYGVNRLVSKVTRIDAVQKTAA